MKDFISSLVNHGTSLVLLVLSYSQVELAQNAIAFWQYYMVFGAICSVVMFSETVKTKIEKGITLSNKINLVLAIVILMLSACMASYFMATAYIVMLIVGSATTSVAKRAEVNVGTFTH